MGARLHFKKNSSFRVLMDRPGQECSGQNQNRKPLTMTANYQPDPGKWEKIARFLLYAGAAAAITLTILILI